MHARQLNIRDPRAAELAASLADQLGMTKTDATIFALQQALAAEKARTPLPERLSVIADRLAAKAGPNRRPMSKAEIDDMWGQ